MRQRQYSKRDVLKLSTTFAVSTVIAKYAKAAAPEPSPITPTLDDRF
jgi:hypothetical protein